MSHAINENLPGVLVTASLPLVSHPRGFDLGKPLPPMRKLRPGEQCTITIVPHRDFLPERLVLPNDIACSWSIVDIAIAGTSIFLEPDRPLDGKLFLVASDRLAELGRTHYLRTRLAWRTCLKGEEIRAVVAFEGGAAFPDGGEFIGALVGVSRKAIDA